MKFAVQFALAMAIAMVSVNQAAAQPRPTAEAADQRDKLLAKLDGQAREKSESLEKRKALYEKKIESINARGRTQEKLLRSTSSATRRRQIAENIQKIQAEKEEILSKISESDTEVNLDAIEQEKRRIILKFPRPDDPKYVEVEGRILDEAEAAKVAEEKARRENSKDPRKVADQYAQLMIDRGILRSAQFVGTERALDQMGFGGPPVAVTQYNYQVVYISRAGLVNERVCGVLVRPKDDYWVVSPSMTMAGTLGMVGLPQMSIEERLQEAFQRRPQPNLQGQSRIFGQQQNK